jgi:hypothetical protein
MVKLESVVSNLEYRRYPTEVEVDGVAWCVTVDQGKPWKDAYSNTTDHTLVVLGYPEEKTAIVFLHELGHVVLKHGEINASWKGTRFVPGEIVIANEITASGWALDRLPRWADREAAEEFLSDCLDTYRGQYGIEQKADWEV